jgi:RHS repeat-associated protein
MLGVSRVVLAMLVVCATLYAVGVNERDSQAHPGHTAAAAECFVNSVRSQVKYGPGGYEPFDLMRFWLSCQYGPVTSAVEWLETRVYSSDWPAIGGGGRSHIVHFDCTTSPSSCTFNQQGLFQGALDVGISGTPTEPWTELTGNWSAGESSACKVKFTGQPSWVLCGSGIWSKAEAGYPPFPLHFWNGSIDGNKVPIGQTYGLPDEDGENPTALWGDPVNSLTGSFYTSMVDAALPGIGTPFRWKRTYNSGGAVDGVAYAPQDGPLGYGWRFTYGARLDELPGGDVVYHAASGKQIKYYLQSDGVNFQRHPGVTATLVKNANGSYNLKRLNGTEMRFTSGTKALSWVKDRNGNQISLSYTSGKLSSITDTAARTIAVATNANGKITSFTLPDGRSVSYTYSSGNLAAVNDLVGNVWEYTYNGAHRLLTIKDPRGVVTVTNSYSGGRVVSQTDGLGNASSFGWDDETDTATFVDEEGKVWTHRYVNNKLVEVIPPTGTAQATQYEYDAGSLRPSRIVEPDGDTWSFDHAYAASGQLQQMTATDPLGRATVTVYTASRQPDTITDPRGQVTDFAYDSQGNLTQIIQPGNVTTTFGYNSSGKLTSVVDADGKATSFTYGAKGNLTKVTDPLGKVTNLTYDSAGRLIEKKDPRQKVWAYAYNNGNQLISITPPSIPATSFTYTKVGSLRKVTDARGSTTTYSYDGNGRLSSIQAPDNSIVTTYTYLKTGQVATTKDANNRTMTYSYDDAGRLTAVTDPLNRTWSYEYRQDGSLKKRVLPSADTVTYQYWPDGAVKNVDYSNTNTPDVSFTYDNAGRVATMVDGVGTVSYEHDDLNRLTAVTRGADQFAYSYLPGGQLDTIVYPGGAATDHDYRDDGRIGSVTVDGGSTSFLYDDAGNLTTIERPNGVTTTYTWDDADRLTNVEHRQGANTLQNYAITQIDGNGNPTRIVGPSGTTNYTYDMFDRLTSVCTPSCAGGTPSGTAYSYDNAGNRLTEVRYGNGGGTTTYHYDAGDQLTSTTGLTSKTYSYDGNGNQTAAGNRSYTYDSEGRMLTTSQGGSTASYTYDGAGDMQSRLIDGSLQATFVWDRNAPISQLAIERDGAGTESRRFAYAPGGPGGLLSMRTGGQSHYFLSDALGSVGALTSETGSLEWTYAYEGYGTQSASQLDPNAPVNPMGFHGQYQEPSGLLNMRARQYDSTTGRFLGVDPVRATTGGGRLVSTYAYGFNQPTVLADPSGLAPSTADFFSSWICGGPCSDTFLDILDNPVASWQAGPMLPKVVGGAMIAVATAYLTYAAVAAAVPSLMDIYSSTTSRVAAAGTTTATRVRDVAGSLSSEVGAIGRGVTHVGRLADGFRNNPSAWTRVSAHAELAAGRAYRGGVSLEEVWVSDRGERIVRHIIYVQDKIAHEHFRPLAKFGG